MTSKPGRENPALLLGVLSAVERDCDVTQRSISSELGIALGLANAYIGRCVRKGLIKICQAPFNRYAYYLTPPGFAEKSRLTAEYLAVSLNFFRDARHECDELIAQCAGAGRRRLVLAGGGELAEIAILSSTETAVEIVCVVDVDHSSRTCAGRPVFADLERAITWAGPAGGIDAVVVTDVEAPQDVYESIVAEAENLGLDRDWIITPSLLRVTRGRRPAMEPRR